MVVKVEFFIVKMDGTYSYHCTLKSFKTSNSEKVADMTIFLLQLNIPGLIANVVPAHTL